MDYQEMVRARGSLIKGEEQHTGGTPDEEEEMSKSQTDRLASQSMNHLDQIQEDNQEEQKSLEVSNQGSEFGQPANINIVMRSDENSDDSVSLLEESKSSQYSEKLQYETNQQKSSSQINVDSHDRQMLGLRKQNSKSVNSLSKIKVNFKNKMQ